MHRESDGGRRGKKTLEEREGRDERERERERSITLYSHYTSHFQVSTGEVNWDYDWNANMPYMSPGMIEGKEPLLDEWEVSELLMKTPLLLLLYYLDSVK